MQREVTPAGTTERFYHNGFEYGASGIELVHTGEGVVNMSTSDNNHRYNYFLKDHLGSTRVVFGEDTQGELIVNQVTDYYAFGLAHEPGFGMGDTRYLYNGKELQDELDLGQNLSPGWLDYGWRMYDPQIGRWHVIDPLVEKYSSYSPYNYVLNNPVRYIDPDGRAVMLPIIIFILDKAGRATKSFVDNYFEMRNEPIVCPQHNDKYYHMKANYEATEQGLIGEATAALISISRELFDVARGSHDIDEAREDMKANKEGRRLGRKNRWSGKEFEVVLPDNWRAMFEQH